MGKIKDYEQLEHFDGNEVFVVETDSGTKSAPFALLNDRIVDVVEDKSEMLNQTDTELSVESNNAIANSAVAAEFDKVKESLGSVQLTAENALGAGRDLKFVLSSQYLNGTFNSHILAEKQYLYVGNYANVYKLDFSNESNPCEKAHNALSNSMSCTGLAVKGNYLYACYRDGSSGFNRNENVKAGMLYIFSKDTLEIVKSIELDWKATRIMIHDNIMIINMQLMGWDLYDISKPTEPELKYSYRVPESEFDEYQGGAVYEQDEEIFYVSGSYGVGLHFWKITDITAPEKVADFLFSWFPSLSGKVHTYDVIVEYPYIYATIATTSVSNFATENDCRGIYKLNISDFSLFSSETSSEIPIVIAKIDPTDLPSTKSGDSTPTRMARYKNYLLTNIGRNGIAIFDISKDEPKYQRFVETSDNGLPWSLYVADDNRIFVAENINEKYIRMLRPVL